MNHQNLKERLQMLLKGSKNTDKVIEGWYNDLKLNHSFLTEEQKNVILERRVICQECPFNSENAKTSEEYRALYGKYYSTTRKTFHCSVCSCPIDTKTASLSSNCGLETYNEEYPKNIQELKWKSTKQ